MTRPRRINLPFCLYHVFSRTNSGDRAFHDTRDRRKFLSYLEKNLDIFQLSVHAYCLMYNHFHLLLESREIAGLSEFMRRLLTAYTVYFNKKYGRHGHLFQGRFKSLIIDKSTYFLELSRYIHLNPAREDERIAPAQYKWSSFRHFVNKTGPKWLKKDETLAWFQNNPQKYGDFVLDGLEEAPDEDILGQIYKQRFIGGESFAKRIGLRLKQHESEPTNKDHGAGADEQMVEHLLGMVAQYYDLAPESIQEKSYAHGKTQEARLAFIYLLRNRTPLSYRQIAELMHYKTIQGAYQAWRKSLAKESIFKKMLKDGKTGNK